MRAVVFVDRAVQVGERPDPTPAPDEVLVQVGGAGINGADILQRGGHYPAPGATPDDQPGLEFAGTVRAVGSSVTRWTAGDRVMGIVSGAGQAELVVVHEDLCMAIPSGLPTDVAGAVPEALVTAHDALVGQAHVGPSDRVLVTGAAGGVGTMAVQLAVGLGATVVASVRGRDRHDHLRTLGAHEVVEPDEQGDAGPWDAVVELVGAPSLSTVLGSLATGARVVVIGVGAGHRLDVSLLGLMAARATLRGSTLRARPLADRIIASRQAAAMFATLHTRDMVRVPVASRHALDDAAIAYEAFEDGGTVGKVLLHP